MQKHDTFGVHFVLRRLPSGKSYLYARITVNGTKCELATKQEVDPNHWNNTRGVAKPKNCELRQLNSLLEEVRGKLIRSYQELRLKDEPVTAELVKKTFLHVDKPVDQKTLLWLVNQHNIIMKGVLSNGTLKNYFTTERYLKGFMKQPKYNGDVLLRKLSSDFITGFDFFVRTTPLKDYDRCTNNGAMKHMERLKKMVNWAVENGWLEKSPFEAFKLKFKYKEREFLVKKELQSLVDYRPATPTLGLVRDLFLFSCYTGLAYSDLVALKPINIIEGEDGAKWIRTSRVKTDTTVYVPLLKPALALLEVYLNADLPRKYGSIFPIITNQEVNRDLKIIAGICGIEKYLTFHLARHTFATTITLMNGVPVESISKMLGHTKLSTTMIYAKVTQGKVAMDMAMLQKKLDAV